MDRRFPVRQRIRLSREFDGLFREGKAFHFREMTLRALPNALAYSRLGLSVGKRCGNAVRRNRIKRLLREAFRLNRELLETPCDIAIAPRPEWRALTLAAIEPVFKEALRKIGRAFAPK